MKVNTAYPFWIARSKVETKFMYTFQRAARVVRACAAMVALGVILAACGSADDSEDVNDVQSPADDGSEQASADDTDPTESVTIGIGGAGVTVYAATYVARELGFIDEELAKVNAEAEWIDLEGSVAAIQALATNDVDYVASVTGAALAASSQGAGISQLMQYNTTDMVFMTATPGLPTDTGSPEELVSGRTWGIPGFGSTAHLSALAALTNWGFTDEDVEWVTLGHVESSAVAVDQQLADYYWLGTVGEQLMAEGAVELVMDLFDPATSEELYGGEYTTAGLFGSTDRISERPEITEAVVTAHVRALEYIDEHREQPEEVLTALPEVMQTDGQIPLLGRILPGYSVTGMVNPDAVQRALDSSVAGGQIDDPEAVDLDAFVANDYHPAS